MACKRLGALLVSVAIASVPEQAAATDLVGTTITFKRYIETEVGYDTNPDNLFRHVSTRFEKLEGGFSVAAKRPTELYELSMRMRGVQFDELEINNRWDFRASLDATFDLAPGQSLKIGTSYLRDFFALNRADVFKQFADYNYKAEDWKLRLQAKSHVELNIERDEGAPPPADIDVFNTVRGRTFDYSKSEGQVALLGFTKFWLQPFAIYNFGHVDYFHQPVDPIIDRNAIEHYGIAGVRVDLGKQFRIDLGGRLNHREFDDLEIRRSTTSFYDVNFLWTPADTFKVKGVIERIFKESSSSFGLVDDVTSYGLTIDWRLAPPLRLVMSGFYEHVIPIGDDFVYNKYTATAVANYEWSKDIDIFVSGLAKQVNEQTTGESYTRYKIGTGVKLKF